MKRRTLCNASYKEETPQEQHGPNNRTTRLPDARNCSTIKDFTQVPNQLLRNPAISGKAKSILCLLLSNKEGWHTYLATIGQMMKEGVDALQSGVRELEEHNYLLRIRYRNKQTKQYAGTFWAYANIPGNFNFTDNLEDLESMGMEVIIPENPVVENPVVDIPEVENPPLIILNSKNTNLKKPNLKQTNSYISTFEKWNFQKIITHKKLTPQIQTSVKRALQDYSEMEIFRGIENYAEVVFSADHYFSHKWTLKDFLKRGLDKFVDAADPLNNFKGNGFKDKRNARQDAGNTSDGLPYPDGSSPENPSGNL